MRRRPLQRWRNPGMRAETHANALKPLAKSSKEPDVGWLVRAAVPWRARRPMCGRLRSASRSAIQGVGSGRGRHGVGEIRGGRMLRMRGALRSRPGDPIWRWGTEGIGRLFGIRCNAGPAFRAVFVLTTQNGAHNPLTWKRLIVECVLAFAVCRAAKALFSELLSLVRGCQVVRGGEVIGILCCLGRGLITPRCKEERQKDCGSGRVQWQAHWVPSVWPAGSMEPDPTVVWFPTILSADCPVNKFVDDRI